MCLITFLQIFFRDRRVAQPNCEQYLQVQEFFSCFQNLRILGEIRAENYATSPIERYIWFHDIISKTCE